MFIAINKNKLVFALIAHARKNTISIINKNDFINDDFILKEIKESLFHELNDIILDYLPHWTDWIECYFYLYLNNININKNRLRLRLITSTKLKFKLNIITQSIEELLQSCTPQDLDHFYFLAMLDTSRWRSYYNYILSVLMTIVWYGLSLIHSRLFRSIVSLVSTIWFTIWSYNISDKILSIVSEYINFLKSSLNLNRDIIIYMEFLFRLLILFLALVPLNSILRNNNNNIDYTITPQSIIIHIVTWLFQKGKTIFDQMFSKFKINYDINFQRYTYEKIITIKNSWKSKININ